MLLLSAQSLFTVPHEAQRDSGSLDRAHGFGQLCSRCSFGEVGEIPAHLGANPSGNCHHLSVASPGRASLDPPVLWLESEGPSAAHFRAKLNLPTTNISINDATTAPVPSVKKRASFSRSVPISKPFRVSFGGLIFLFNRLTFLRR